MKRIVVRTALAGLIFFPLAACSKGDPSAVNSASVTQKDCEAAFPRGARSPSELGAMTVCLSRALHTDYGEDRAAMIPLEQASGQQWAADNSAAMPVGKTVAGQPVNELGRAGMASLCRDGTKNKLRPGEAVSSSLRVDRGHPRPRITCMLVKNDHFAGTATVDVLHDNDVIKLVSIHRVS